MPREYEEFQIPGDRDIPTRDEATYNDFWRMPTWEDLLDLIEEEDITRCDLVVIGKIYRGANNVGGSTFHVANTDELYNVPEPGEGIGNPQNTPFFVERLFGWWGNPPPHVAAFVVRRV